MVTLSSSAASAQPTILAASCHLRRVAAASDNHAGQSRPCLHVGLNVRISQMRPSRGNRWSANSGGSFPFAERQLWNGAERTNPHSALMLAARITLPHFSVSSAINLSKAAGESVVTIVPNSAKRAFTAGSARTALISLLSLSMIGAGVFLGAPTPDQEVTS